MEKYGLFKGLNSQGNMVLVLPVSEPQSSIALATAAKLRDADVPALVEVSGRGVRDALSYASGLGFRAICIIGPREVESGRATLRDLASKAQTEVSFDDVVGAVKNLLIGHNSA
jgi:histidyl-tRNA synthetase